MSHDGMSVLAIDLNMKDLCTEQGPTVNCCAFDTLQNGSHGDLVVFFWCWKWVTVIVGVMMEMEMEGCITYPHSIMFMVVGDYSCN